MEKDIGETVRARSLAFRGFLKCLVYFLDCYWPEKRCVLLRGDEGGHMPRYLVDSLMSICEGFCEEILKIAYQSGFHVTMGVDDVPVIGDEMSDLVGVPPLDDSSIEEFGVALPFLEPLHSRFLFP